jgi:dTDP-4-dehydrorhamnose reductase
LKRVIITGSNGLLGQSLVSVFTRESDHELILTSTEDKPFTDFGHIYRKLDITDKEEVKKMIGFYEPDTIINAAAYTEVDKCEEERELCWKINVDGVKNLIIAGRGNDARIVHFSTDYIFDGKNGPYDEEATPKPLACRGKCSCYKRFEMHYT